MLERVWRKGNPLTLLVGMQTNTATMENSVVIPCTGKTQRDGMGRELGGGNQDGDHVSLSILVSSVCMPSSKIAGS